VTRGGIRIESTDENRNIPFDGKMADIKGLDWKTFTGARMSGTMVLQANAVTPLGTEDGTTGGNVTTQARRLPAGELRAAGDYIENLRLYFPATGLQVRFPWALCTAFGPIQTTDREEATVAFTFEARSDQTTAVGANPGTPPWVIEQLSAFS
jgi:hypothetical protein